MNGVLLCPDPDPAPAAAAAVIPLAVLEDAVPIEGATGLHLPLLPPLPQALAGLHLAVVGPGHILAATDTLPVAAAETTIGTGGDILVSLLFDDTGHTLAPTAVHPRWTTTIAEAITVYGQDPQATGADTVTAELRNIDANFPDLLPDPSEADQDPGLQNAPLL